MRLIFVFFFFSSRRRHTRLQGDWSSDVCSSDLDGIRHAQSRVQKSRDQRGGPVHSGLCPRASGGLRRPIVPAMMRFDTQRPGFTLLEVLIAVAIVAVIALLGYRALAALSDAETRLAAEATRWRTLDLFFARLE